MRAFLALALASLTVAGCRDYEKSYAEDGTREFRLECSAPADCELRAGQLCKKRGYHLSERRDSEGRLIVHCDR